MTQQVFRPHDKGNQAMSPEQFNQIIDAILAGKYSWACFLLLRCVGYNPVDYMPYRTYHRLVKENCQIGKLPETYQSSPDRQFGETQFPSMYSGKPSSQISDLPYLEEVREQHARVRGGYSYQEIQGHSPKAEWMLSKVQGFFRLASNLSR